MRNNTVILIKNLAQRGLMHMFGGVDQVRHDKTDFCSSPAILLTYSGFLIEKKLHSKSKGEYGYMLMSKIFCLFFCY